MLHRVGKGGGHHCSSELTTRDCVIANNFAFSSHQLAAIGSGCSENSGVDGGNGDRFGGVGGYDEVDGEGDGVRRDHSSAESHLFQFLNIFQVG